ncbi:hypothetical protein [Metabacillus fastidiosus]
MKYYFDLLLAILLTSFSYYLAGLFISNGLAAWQAFIIGFSVVSLGAYY